MGETSVEIIEQPDKFSSIKSVRDGGGWGYYSFSHGALRSLFTEGTFDCPVKDFWRPDAEFHFVRTVANVEAVTYIMSCNKGKDPDDRGWLRYNMDLMGMYLKVLHELLTLDGVAHVYYPLVQGDSVHSLEQHWAAPTWPVIHCFRLPMGRAFESYLDELHDKRGLEVLNKRDSPQHYERPAITALREAGLVGIAPIVMDGRRAWKVSGHTLRDAIDFLSQMSYSAPDRGGGCYHDD